MCLPFSCKLIGMLAGSAVMQGLSKICVYPTPSSPPPSQDLLIADDLLLCDLILQVLMVVFLLFIQCVDNWEKMLQYADFIDNIINLSSASN